ncbi:MAG: AAA family ATPase [Pseudomonadota bacterium]
MNCWLMRPYPHNINRIPHFLENNIIAIGWPGIGDLTACDKHSIQQRILDKYGEVKTASVNTIVQFKDEISIGDLVLVVPKKEDGSELAIGKVISAYLFNPEYDDYNIGYSHQRQVNWLEKRFARQKLPDDIQKTLNLRGTLKKLNKDKADRLIKFLKSKGYDLKPCQSLGEVTMSIGMSMSSVEVNKPTGFRLELKNYRGIEAVELNPNGVCLIVGPNGAGKTTLLKSITLLSNTFKKGFGLALNLEGGAKGFQNFKLKDAPTLLAIEIDNLRWEISPNINRSDAIYPLPERLKQNGRFLFKTQPSSSRFEYEYAEYVTDETTVALRRIYQSDRYHGQFDRLIQQLKKYRHYHDYQLMELRRSGSPANSGTELEPYGLNAFAVLKEWKTSKPFFERYEFVLDILQETFPEFAQELSFPTAGQTVSLEVYPPDSNFPIPINHLSNGFLCALLHLMAVCSVPDNGIVAIDEPENGLHPYAIKMLIEALRERAQERHLTILLATHSGFILNEFKEEAHRVYVMDGEQQLSRLDTLEDPEWLKHFSLGDLYGKQFGIQGE